MEFKLYYRASVRRLLVHFIYSLVLNLDMTLVRLELKVKVINGSRSKVIGLELSINWRP